MGRWRVLAALPIVTAGIWMLGPPSASASCVGPTLAVTPAHARAGDPVRISGEWWATDCDDVIANGVHVYHPKPDTVQIYFVQAGSKSLLDTVTAAPKQQHYALSARLTIPSSARTGAATVEAVGRRAGTASAPLTVIRSSGPPATSQQLPFTGATIAAQLSVACLAVTVGAGLIARARRPNT